MDHMIEAIRIAVTAGATPEQKAVGVQACRTIMAALDAEPGKTIALPGAPTPGPLAGVPPGQLLDLLIARLSTMAEQKAKTASTAPVASTTPLRIALVQPPPRRKP